MEQNLPYLAPCCEIHGVLNHVVSQPGDCSLCVALAAYVASYVLFLEPHAVQQRAAVLPVVSYYSKLLVTLM